MFFNYHLEDLMKLNQLRLHHYILLVAFLSFVLAITSMLWSSYQINSQTLKENTLESNRVYAQKLAQTTEVYLNTTLKTLEYSAGELANFMDNEDRIMQEAARLRNQMNTFNSIVIADADGKILATSPENLNLKNQMLNSVGGKEALTEKKPIISSPYVGLSGHLIIMISTPIFDRNQNYLGLVGGSLYLEEVNILHELLGEHFYEDESHVYVVNQSGKIIYHHDSKRILDSPKNNKVIEKVMRGENGASQLVNSKGTDMLAGYASIPVADWGIVAQRETEASIQPAETMMKTMFLASLPLLLVSLIVIFAISKKIAHPLNQLAFYAEINTEKHEEADLNQINTFYYEAIELKKSLLTSFSYLHNQMNHFMEQSTTDQLTGLLNRRAFEAKSLALIESKTPFSIAFIDIDNFKVVNDTYGHHVGDQVLQYLTVHILSNSRDPDVCYRYGGEEFVILLPETSTQEAWVQIDQVRQKLSEIDSPTGKPITISAGISTFPQNGSGLSDLTLLADKHLYQAKNEGRNRVIMNP